jgi:hypothetical protein
VFNLNPAADGVFRPQMTAYRNRGVPPAAPP